MNYPKFGSREAIKFLRKHGYKVYTNSATSRNYTAQNKYNKTITFPKVREFTSVSRTAFVNGLRKHGYRENAVVKGLFG